MGSWGDTFTEQLRADIFIDQLHAQDPDLTSNLRSGRAGARLEGVYPRCDKQTLRDDRQAQRA